jgi:hypothetical protein
LDGNDSGLKLETIENEETVPLKDKVLLSTIIATVVAADSYVLVNYLIGSHAENLSSKKQIDLEFRHQT